MKDARTLRLRRDSLAELRPDELSQAAGAAPSVFCTSAVTYCDAVCVATTAAEDPTAGCPPLPTHHRCA